MAAKDKWISMLAGAAAFVAMALPASADPANGLRIARIWCAACHVVAPDQPSGSADVPAFSAIAANYTSPQALAAFLTDPHPKMPDMNLSRDEIADIVGYIESLGPNPPPPVRIEPNGPDRG